MASSQFHDNDDLLSNASTGSGSHASGLWSCHILRSKAAPIYKERLGLTPVKAPGDGDCLIHSLTRSLGLLPPKGWSADRTRYWARLFRSHLARHISSEADQAFLHSDNYLEDRFAIYFARLWRLRISMHPLAEFPARRLHFVPPQVYPLQLDDDLLAVDVLFYSARAHFDYLVPGRRNFFAHSCTITVKDLRAYFSDSDAVSQTRFDRFIFKWLDVLRSPNPESDDRLYRFNSLADFVSLFPENSWPALPLQDEPLVGDNSVFICDEDASRSVLLALGGIEDGVSVNSTAGTIDVAAPHSSRYLNNR